MVKKRDLTLRLELPYFELLKCLQKGLSISEIAKYRKVSRQAIYSILSSAIKKGLVRKVGYAVYELTDKGTQTLHSLVGLRYKLRQHNLWLKIKVLESKRNWDLKRNEIRFLPYHIKTIKLKNNEQDIFSFGKLQVKTTTKSIIIKMPTIYAENWEFAVVQAMQILEDSIYKIEHQFKIKLIKDYKANIKIISQEYAKIQDALAKLYRSEGNRIYLTGEDGKIWLITDFSFSTDELEFIHPEKATDDIDVIAPFFNDLRKNPITLTNIREETKAVLEVARASMQNEVKHQKVLDEILSAFKKINERLDKAGL
ncbi:MAG: hypothetical protein WC758_08205 [Candidatus Woesearchaeota archaeon]|jgi:DNA-binding PadR family transcriptional regulator